MNDLTVVLAKLTDAIESLQSRVQDLAPLEKLKLKALRLNLQAAQGCLTETSGTATIHAFPVKDRLATEPLEEKLRRLDAMSARTRAETRLLITEARQHIARSRTLQDAMLSIIQGSECVSEQASHSNLSRQSEAPAIVTT